MRKAWLFAASMVALAGCGSNATTVTKTGTAAAAGNVASGPFERFRIPSPSMEPTLSPGQVVTVSLDPHYVPRVGDIVLFHPPAGADPLTPACQNKNQGAGQPQVCDAPTSGESSSLFIKRVVAGPGDRISLINGHVIRNGVQEQDGSYTEPCGSDPSCSFLTPVTIPSGDYFVLGDNRGASDDGRFWGPVPRSFIIGKVLR